MESQGTSFAWKHLVQAAEEASAKGRHDEARELFQKALKTAEGAFGLVSGDVALVLMAMIKYYEAQQNKAEVNILKERLRQILETYAGDFEPESGFPS